ncbi:branched-chain alpha-keto acid dehydrogenase subunit E2 [Planococcus antarcticus DSM 14505]|uniref:Dihydrolipoamide acetyltransferase component of pyruvate dehydrogenase complex n=1 Tax=Planococcus antarcticus DSM 14505 TaxID=1185653 RepID=A0A1C7DL43_9BACL|nr:dihydrolipoamide acetyltransferase family protein [Planococcus antarcticus]ANU12236.1 branched-chain alpha-keto acid dehydrogenase subunit E2 [Planococcus antarcticus DSM 14505]EIM05213.1 branched-chain alpha-keto acid dehydrogenase subunit E2 [Planococcus antarcticus DSM 14505]
MAIENIKMPQLGESVTEGTIEKWLVQPGDHVNKYDPLAEVNTDKVTAEVPSSFTGTIKELLASEGETLAVGEIVCTIETEGGDAAPAEEAKPTSGDKETEMPAAGAKPTEKLEGTEGSSQPVKPSGSKGRYSPAVLRLAQDNDIDLTQVEGSGNEGRITRKDLMALIDSGNIPKVGDAPAAQAQTPQKEQPAAQPASAQEAPKAAPAAIESAPGDIEIPVTGVRKAIAANMLKSKHEAPHAWMMIEVDVTNLVQYRDSIKGDFKKKEGFNITYFAFFVKAVSQALKEFPMMNSMWAGDKIIQKKDINISIAVASDSALFVPVIRNSDEKSVKGIGKEVNELAMKARSGKIKSADMQGGTFTVNNTGSFGSVQSMGIINHPQAAIMQVESIVKRPVIMDNGMIAARDMVNLCLSLDHRVLDGLVCGQFLARVKEILENMSKENTSVY